MVNVGEGDVEGLNLGLQLGDKVVLHDELLAEPGATCPSSSPSQANRGSAS